MHLEFLVMIFFYLAAHNFKLRRQNISETLKLRPYEIKYKKLQHQKVDRITYLSAGHLICKHFISKE